jgi:hypothetical protein
MPSLTCTATAVGTARSSPIFLNDATGLECSHFGLPAPATYDITNLSAATYNVSDNLRDQLCQIILFRPQFTMAAGQTRTKEAAVLNSQVEAAGWVAHDVLPGTYRIRIDWIAGSTATPCAFGTQRKAGVDPAVSLSSTLLIAILTRGQGVWAAPFLDLFVGHILDAAQICTGLPPPLPNVTANLPNESPATWLKIIEYYAWFEFCECRPGTPTPTPPTIIVIVEPPDWIVLPVFPPCVNSDLCATLQAVFNIAVQLQRQMTQVLTVQELLQRYGLPFAYIRGRRFSTLTATGSSSIERCVGLLIEVTQAPAENTRMLGAPEYIFDLGWISVLTGDGMLDEIRLTRQAMTWMSKLIPSAIQVGWALRDGVTIEISELLAEP